MSRLGTKDNYTFKTEWDHLGNTIHCAELQNKCR